jgi:hypothetical protein
MAIATQFAFEAGPIIDWVNRLAMPRAWRLPVHIGVAGPAKLQTLIKFAVACGVGPSLKVLQKRAMDVTKLVLPYEPTEVLSVRAGRAQGRQPRLRHRACSLLPPRRHQDLRRTGRCRNGGDRHQARQRRPDPTEKDPE